jgi:miniconductance mechanosensitive channel
MSLPLFDQHPWLLTLLALAAALLAASTVRIVAEAIAKRLFGVIAARTTWRWDDALLAHGFIHRLAQILTPLLFQLALPHIPHLPAQAETVLHNVTSALSTLYAVLAANAVLNALHDVLSRNAKFSAGSVKSYVQVGKIILFAIATIVIVATLIDKSPLILLSGIGAMSAVLLLVFRDTLLSFVASIQLSSNDMLRVGDWIEMPQVGADGDVIDIALHTVKVRNWDNTITTIPTWRLIGESFKNWRGMQQAGGRRIKRSLRLDTQGVRFLDNADIERLRKLVVLHDYLDRKCADVTAANAQLGDSASVPANTRRLTNVGTFRAYAQHYLDSHPDIHRDMTCMVRQLEAGPEGVPMEIYCFTRTTAWTEYEAIQGDIFDHLISILPEFGLQLFQNPSGADVRALARN